ncbi:hypothetical protein SAMN02745157_1437 [Kaistia soli DSM 19436]|uniref:Uncharacterized protein n=1 Tax=Kaistia soli DSM 19436 TaxID=1122133 RepID=A0A1M4Y636_9HYPH|nr:hypothetical protein [Kaistia soli]SHF01274.1 hypothetical protein SAMN02745157_1437 [Kaistia soli DSM 19436]
MSAIRRLDNHSIMDVALSLLATLRTEIERRDATEADAFSAISILTVSMFAAMEDSNGFDRRDTAALLDTFTLDLVNLLAARPVRP